MLLLCYVKLFLKMSSSEGMFHNENPTMINNNKNIEILPMRENETIHVLK